MAVVLLLFLGSLRTTLIAPLAIPLSLVAGVLVISLFGQTVNTMTLGGLTIAIGLLVDDAIIAVENVFRRLKGEQERPEDERRSIREVVAASTSEVVSPILFATLIIVLVFLPIFFLPGLEGRLLRPLGFDVSDYGEPLIGPGDPQATLTVLLGALAAAPGVRPTRISCASGPAKPSASAALRPSSCSSMRSHGRVSPRSRIRTAPRRR